MESPAADIAAFKDRQMLSRSAHTKIIRPEFVNDDQTHLYLQHATGFRQGVFRQDDADMHQPNSNSRR